MNLMRTAALVLVLGVVTGCASSSNDATTRPTPTPTPSGSSTSTPTPKDGGSKEAGAHVVSDALTQCAASKGDINSIADAVARANSLIPKGGDGACFIATLPRPLAVVATVGVTSAQPAGGRGAPRIFFMLPKIVISAVPAGDGSKALEFGEWVGTTRTLKAEIGLPVTTTIASDGPFTRILQGTDKSVCATCHRQEERHPTIPNGFISAAFQPEPATFVTLEDLEELHRLCTVADDPGPRCAMIHSVFDFGEVTQGAFSPVVETFFKTP